MEKGGEEGRGGDAEKDVDELEELRPQRGALLGGEALEEVDVDPTGDRPALRTDQEAARRVGGQRADVLAQLVDQRAVDYSASASSFSETTVSRG